MLRIEHTDTYGWEAAIRGLRNPMNSWLRSDSHYGLNTLNDEIYVIGDADYNLCKRMNATTEQSKYRRMITVTMDVTAPLYWWKEFDTYKVGTVCNSCSTMHKIAVKEFELDDFSCEHLYPDSIICLEDTIHMLNKYRNSFNETKNKDDWWQMIQLLPTSYNQRRTIQLNYEVLASIYRQRKSHKLDEWHIFCDWIKTLPYSTLITGEDVAGGY